MALHTGQQTYISLYTGGGGLDLGFRLANPDAVPLLYVERELPAAAFVVDHIKAGLLDEAPVWSDTGTLDCRPFAGKVDWFVSGFPCQPFSYAGKRRGTDDERWLWEHIRRLASEIRPRYLFLENTPGLLVRSGIGTVLGELSEIGYDSEYVSVRASAVGAPHRRERVFILAYSTRDGGQGSYRQTGRERGRGVRLSSKQLGNAEHDGLSASEEPRGTGQGVLDGQEGQDSSEQPERSGERSRGASRVAHSDNRLGDRQIEEVRAGRSPSVNGSERVAHPIDSGNSASGNGDQREGSKRTEGREDRPQPEPRGSGKHMGNASVGRDQDRDAQPSGEIADERRRLFPPPPNDRGAWAEVLRERPDLAPAVESEVRGVVDESSRTLDRTSLFKILGNGVVPLQAHYGFQVLTRRINGSTTTSK